MSLTCENFVPVRAQCLIVYGCNCPSETRKMQRLARENVHRILAEQEKLNDELERKKRKIDFWSKELNKREVVTERERLKLDEDKKKAIGISNPFCIRNFQLFNILLFLCQISICSCLSATSFFCHS